MFKLIVTCKKKVGMSLDAFIEHYEKTHLPLARDIFPPMYMHQRNYILPDHPFYDFLGDDRTGDGRSPPFDVVTKMFFETEEQARTCLSGMNDAAIRKMIVDDETNLFAPGGINFYVTRTYQTSLPWK